MIVLLMMLIPQLTVVALAVPVHKIMGTPRARLSLKQQRDLSDLAYALESTPLFEGI